MDTRILVHDAELLDLAGKIRALPAGADLGFDVEYDCADDDPMTTKLVGFGLYSPGAFSVYVPTYHLEGMNARPEAWPKVLKAVVDATDSCRVWGWSIGTAELLCLRLEGVPVDHSDKWYDGIVAAWLAGWGTEGDLKLKDLAIERLPVACWAGNSFPTFKQLAKGRRASAIPAVELGPYCAKDAWLCVELGVMAYSELDDDLRKHFHELDMPCVEPVARMQREGLHIDAAALRALEARLAVEAADIARKFEDLTRCSLTVKERQAVVTGKFKNGKDKTRMEDVDVVRERGANVSKDREVSRWCFEELKVWPTAGLKRTGTGFFPTDKETLEQFIPLGGLAQELVELRLAYSARSKLLSTYIRPLLDIHYRTSTGKVHPRQSIVGTETQRFAHSGPNFGNLPSRTEDGKLVRAAVVCGPGESLACCDMNQAELRVAADLSDDEALRDAFLFGDDLHNGTLDVLKRHWPDAQRVHAKTTTFSSMYGITAKTLAIKAKVSEDKAEAMLCAFRERFAGYVKFTRRCEDFVRKNGYMYTKDGFKRKIDNTLQTNWRTREKDISQYAKNAAPSTAIQGTVGGVLKRTIVALHRKWLADGSYDAGVAMLVSEHDSILIKAPHALIDRAAEDVVQAMQTVMTFKVPFRADKKIGKTWMDCK